MKKIKNNFLLFFYLLTLAFFIGWIVIGNINSYGAEPILMLCATLLGIFLELALRIKKVTGIAKLLRWIVVGLSIVTFVFYALSLGGILDSNKSFNPSYIEVACLYILTVFVLAALFTKIGRKRSFKMQIALIVFYALCFVAAAFTYKSIVPIIICCAAVVLVYIGFIGFFRKVFDTPSSSSSSSSSSSTSSTTISKGPIRCEYCQNYEEYSIDCVTCRHCKHYGVNMDGNTPDYSTECSLEQRQFYESYYGNWKCESFVPKK